MKKILVLKKEIEKHHNSLLKMLHTAEGYSLEAGNRKLVKLILKAKSKFANRLNALEEKSEALYPYVTRMFEKKTGSLKNKIKVLNKAKDSLTSDNYLLEYKKKDLLLLTTKLEEVNDRISEKNKELLLQQKKISEQTEKLNQIHKEILDKNQELEQQKESLLDQSDYLHEANETITRMHVEVEKQKDEILQKNEELLNLNIEKNNLISIVAHDLKSPLQQIKGLVSVIKLNKENLNSDILSYVEMIEKSAVRLTDMIGKILDVEAIELKKLNLKLEEVNLTETLRSVANRFVQLADAKSIRLKVNIETGILISADKGYVEQVCENLISNAIKFSPSNRKVFVTLRTRNEWAVVEVKDQGPGINEEDKKKLFGKYQKLSARPTGNETSTGLGLLIVKKFVEAMSGQISFESTLGHGATFSVSFKKLNATSIG